MKKTRILAFLCALILTLSMASFASADSKPVAHLQKTGSNYIGYEGNYYVLANGETAKFLVGPGSAGGSLYSSKGGSYRDIIFDCASAVTAKCSAKWVHITNLKGGFVLNYDANDTQKNRSATVNVTGKNYSAKFKLTQYGKSVFTSVVRNKKTVTAKFKLAAGAKEMYLYVYAYQNEPDSEGYRHYKNLEIKLPEGVTSYKIKVKPGWNYNLELEARIEYAKGQYTWQYTDYVYFNVTDDNVNQKVTIR